MPKSPGKDIVLMIDGTRQGPEDPQSIPTNVEGLAYYFNAPSIRRADKSPVRLMLALVCAVRPGQMWPVISAGRRRDDARASLAACGEWRRHGSHDPSPPTNSFVNTTCRVTASSSSASPAVHLLQDPWPDLLTVWG